MSQTPEERAREVIASEVCEAKYSLHPDSDHHDVQTCAECYRFADEQVAAVRRAAFAECVTKLESEECVESLAHAVDDINPRRSHTEDQADARIYCRHIAGFLLRALPTMEALDRRYERTDDRRLPDRHPPRAV